jgi:hypothetical protein
MMFWNAELLGWIVCWKQSVEKTMEIASANETDIANLHWLIWVTWTWPPHGMSIRRILDCKLFAEDLVVGHRKSTCQGKLSTPVGGRDRGPVERFTAYSYKKSRNTLTVIPHARQCSPPQMVSRLAPTTIVTILLRACARRCGR